MAALLDPVNRRKGGVRWGLASHVTTMFLVTTIYTAILIDRQSASYIENREFSGDLDNSGPFNYEFLLTDDAVSFLSGVMFFVNTLLVDGLLASFASNSADRCLTYTGPQALSLLYYLCHELLGRRPSVSDVPRLYWCVIKSSRSWRKHR
jgi:hypothetical protein